MKYDEIKQHMSKKVSLTTTSGKVFRGILTNTESEFDTSSGKDEVEIDLGKVFVGVPFDSIKRIILLD